MWMWRSVSYQFIVKASRNWKDCDQCHHCFPPHSAESGSGQGCRHVFVQFNSAKWSRLVIWQIFFRWFHWCILSTFYIFYIVAMAEKKTCVWEPAVAVSAGLSLCSLQHRCRPAGRETPQDRFESWDLNWPQRGFGRQFGDQFISIFDPTFDFWQVLFTTETTLHIFFWYFSIASLHSSFHFRKRLCVWVPRAVKQWPAVWIS